MPCPTCASEAPPSFDACGTCNTPVGSPPLYPDVPTYGVRQIGVAAAVAVGVGTLSYQLLGLVALAVPTLAEQAQGQDDGRSALVAVAATGLVGLLHLVSLVTAGVLVIIWTYRARRNLDAFPGSRASLSAGVGIAGWLVPLVNLVLPFLVLAELARDSLWRERTPPSVVLWWAGWLAFMVGDRISGNMDDPSAFWQLLPMVGCALAGTALVVLIMRISSAQEARVASGRPAWPVLPGTTVTSPQVPPVPGGTIGA
ncbi:protein of unknown function [Micromonospora halophytica]|uniref:DUF4328 domain-containing protein n=1 Tax=Micromonospora halophytica TaxID=47864 RepID=A0A1C5HA54_9ACTN|nr:protein of unknown function [Micromonospora halophytica]